jgi:hypothetical protein
VLRSEPFAGLVAVWKQLLFSHWFAKAINTTVAKLTGAASLEYGSLGKSEEEAKGTNVWRGN